MERQALIIPNGVIVVFMDINLTHSRSQLSLMHHFGCFIHVLRSHLHVKISKLYQNCFCATDCFRYYLTFGMAIAHLDIK